MVIRISIAEFAASTRAFSRVYSRTIQQGPVFTKPLPAINRHFFLYHSGRQYSTPTTPSRSPQDAKPRDLRSQLSSAIPETEAKVEAEPTTYSYAKQPKPKRSLLPYIYATAFLLLGVASGQFVRLVLSPPALPLPGTPEDKAMAAVIRAQAEKIPVVQSLSQDPDWTSWEAYANFTPEELPGRLTTGPLGGSRGLGAFQRIFHNEATGEFVSVVWFGGALAGWPGVTHGGVIATVLDESLGRCAMMRFPGRTGVTANLELNYLRPSYTNGFYVVRVVPLLEGNSERKAWVSGRLETLDGKVCVEAKALFVAPKKLETRAWTGKV